MSFFNKLIQLYNPFLNGGTAVVNIITPIFAVISFFVPYEAYFEVPIKISYRYLIGVIIIIIAIIWLYINYSKLDPSLICGSEGKISDSKACILMEPSKKLEYGNLVSFYHKDLFKYDPFYRDWRSNIYTRRI